MIGADAHSSAILFANFYQRCKLLSNAIKLSIIRSICIFYLFKFFLVCIVAGINAHFLYNSGSKLGCVWGEMNISNQRNFIPSLSQFIFYLQKALSLFDAGGCYSHILATCIYHANGLLN